MSLEQKSYKSIYLGGADNGNERLEAVQLIRGIVAALITLLCSNIIDESIIKKGIISKFQIKGCWSNADEADGSVIYMARILKFEFGEESRV